jgi:hypothetical protein
MKRTRFAAVFRVARCHLFYFAAPEVKRSTKSHEAELFFSCQFE